MIIGEGQQPAETAEKGRGDDLLTMTALRNILLAMVAGLVVALVAGAFTIYLVGFADWDGTQFGAIGSWLAAIATAATAVVAVVQTTKANKQARAAEKRAEDDATKRENRHSVELNAANDRLARELDAQRREQQVATVVQVAVALNRFIDMSSELVKYYEDMPKPTTGSAQSEASAKYVEWKRLYRTLLDSFVAPNLLVSDLPTRKILGEIQSSCSDFKRHATAVQKGVKSGYGSSPADIGSADRAVKEIREGWRSVLSTARINIAKVPALSDTEIQELETED